MTRSRGRRAGFTLMEVAVAAVLIAVLAAATIPTLSEFLNNRDAASTAETLSEIGVGIDNFRTAVLTSGTAGTFTYPRFISQLTTQITPTGGANATTRNSCYGAHNATAVSNWTSKGPFLSFYIPIGGLNTPLGVIQDSMFRSPNSATAGRLEIRMNVDSMDAVRLDRIIDGGDGAAAGVLRITFTGSGGSARRADLAYWIPVTSKC